MTSSGTTAYKAVVIPGSVKPPPPPPSEEERKREEELYAVHASDYSDDEEEEDDEEDKDEERAEDELQSKEVIGGGPPRGYMRRYPRFCSVTGNAMVHWSEEHYCADHLNHNFPYCPVSHVFDSSFTS